MCGIAGYLGSRKLDKCIIDRTLNMMKNRGPNNQSFSRYNMKNRNVFLLHSRLSIIDLDKRSNQPFEKDGIVITFNGELYNYIEIRNNLIKLGHNFKTNSDTEVILEAYKRYKDKCVKFFEGMWAFAIFDSRDNTVCLSRDRLGEKPLYFLNFQGEFFFGSETKFIISLVDRYLNLNYTKLKNFLVNGYRSMFNHRDSFILGINELKPSTNFIINHNLKIQEFKYWQLKFSPRRIKEQDIYDNVLQLLTSSMKIRMRSDVPVAFCLSGGVDSTSLACLAKVVLNKKIETFSIVDRDRRYDESKNIKITTDFLNCKSSLVENISNNFVEEMTKIIKYYNSPVPTISYYIHNIMVKEMKSSGFSVSISGTGADEIFGGYYDHYLFWLYEMRKHKKFNKFVDEWRVGYGKHTNNPLLKDPYIFIDNKNYREHLHESSKLFNKLIKDTDVNDFKEVYFCEDLLRNRMLNELQTEVVPPILYSDDLNSMMYSLENRSPFLDSKLIEFLYTIPSKFLIKRGFQKYILRNSIKKIIPSKIFEDKKKVGFNASIYSLINLNSSDTIDWLLEDSLIFEIICKKQFNKALKKDFSNNSMSKFLFSFISSKIFLDSYKTILN